MVIDNIDRAIERLLTDEALTADVDDAAAKALLRWGEEQIKAGRPEEAVRQGVRALNKLVAKRSGLDPAAARARLEAAGLAADPAALAPLWAEPLPEGEWAQRLLQALTPAARPPSAAAPLPLSPERGEGVRATPWWHHLLFWRKQR